MLKSRSTVSKITLATILLLSASASSIVMAKRADAATLNPSGSWTSTMIEGQSAGTGYCALTRKFNDEMIVTFGQSALNEFSLALDFQSKGLNVDKAYDIELSAGGQNKKYEMLPASDTALVVRLGYDDSFVHAIKKSGVLKTKIDGETYDFTMNDIGVGQVELSKCMAGLTGAGNTQVAIKSAPKVEDATVADKVAKVEKIIEAPVVANKPINIEDIEVPKPIEISRVESKAVEPVKDVQKVVNIEDQMPVPVIAEPKIISKAVIEPKEEVAAVEKKSIGGRFKSIFKKSDKSIVVDNKSKKVEPVIAKSESVKVEPVKQANIKTDRPQKAVKISRVPDFDNEQKAPVKVAVAGRKLSPTEFDEQLKVRLDAEKKEKRSQIKVVNALDDKPETKNMIDVPVVKVPKDNVIKTEEVKAAPVIKKDIEVKVAQVDGFSQQELSAPKPFSSLSSSATKKPKNSDVKIEMAVVDRKVSKAEEIEIIEPVEILEVKKAKIKVPEVELKSPAVPVPRPPKIDIVAKKQNDEELKDIRSQLSELERENRTLFLEAKKARGDIDKAVVNTSNEALKKMRQYEQKLEAARADNLALAKDIEEMRRIQEDADVLAASNDPNAQKSVQRYNEAQREIKRLGMLLQQQKLAHRQEKSELENMLFDPAVTDEAQRKKLSDLERKLQTTQNRLDEEAKRVNVVDTQKQEKLKELEQKLATAQLREKQLKAEELKLKTEAKKVEAAEAKLSALTMKEKLLKDKEARLLAQKEAIEAKVKTVANAENKLAQARLKEQEMRAREEKVKLEQEKIVQAELKIAEARGKEQRVLAQQKILAEKQRLLANAEAKLVNVQAKEQEMNAKEEALKAQERRISQQAQRLNQRSRVPAPVVPQVQVAQIPPQISLNQPVNRPYRSINNQASITQNAVTSTNLGASQQNLQRLLNNSGIAGFTSLSQQSPNLYVWRANGLNGRAEFSPQPSTDINQFAQGYIARERQSCGGDFASLPSSLAGAKTGYELACVNSNGSGKAASVVFVQKEGKLMVISHETAAENMDAAIDARDKIAKFL